MPQAQTKHVELLIRKQGHIHQTAEECSMFVMHGQAQAHYAGDACL